MNALPGRCANMRGPEKPPTGFAGFRPLSVSAQSQLIPYPNYFHRSLVYYNLGSEQNELRHSADLHEIRFLLTLPYRFNSVSDTIFEDHDCNNFILSWYNRTRKKGNLFVLELLWTLKTCWNRLNVLLLYVSPGKLKHLRGFSLWKVIPNVVTTTVSHDSWLDR